MPKPPRKAKRKPKPVKPAYSVAAGVYNDTGADIFEDFASLNAYCDAKGYVRPDGSDSAGMAVSYPNKDGGNDFFAVIPRSANTLTVAHECLHLAFYVLRYVGVKVTMRNHEALAYLQQHFTEQCLKHRKRLRHAAKKHGSRKPPENPSIRRRTKKRRRNR